MAEAGDWGPFLNKGDARVRLCRLTDRVLGADSDDAAHLFRDDRAHHSEMMPPIGGAFVGGLI